MPSERRLHPISLVLNLGTVLKEFLLPALVLLFAASSRGGSWQAWLSFLLIPYAAVAITRYLTFRFRYDPTELVVRWGLLFRRVRHVPYARIQNLDARQNPLHRLFGVAEVRVETGAGIEPEAVLSVLPLAEVAEMRRRVFGGAEPLAAVEPSGQVLLRLPTRELALAGLIENRGMVLILTLFGIAWETGLMNRLLGILGVEAWGEGIARELWGGLTGVRSIPLGRIAFMAAVLLAVLLAIRLLSMGWAVIRLHDFKLIRDGEDLRTEYGLLTRVSETIPLRRVQTITVREGPLHRLFRRSAIRVATAGGQGLEGAKRPREWLAPIIPSENVAALLREVQPGVDWAGAEWQAAHPRAARRVYKHWLVVALVVSVPAGLVMEWRALAVFAAIALWGVPAARLYAKHLGWVLLDDAVAVRSGWVGRYWTGARFNRVQAVALHESPFDRRTGMGRIAVDTAGASEAFALNIPYLSRDTAQRLHDRLAAEAGGAEFQW